MRRREKSWRIGHEVNYRRCECGVLKWYLDDETEGDAALLLLKKYVAEEIDLIAPSLLEYEVISGLVIAQRRRRIPQTEVIGAIAAFQELDIRLERIGGICPNILSYPETYRRSVNDEAYCEVTEWAKADFVTADKTLYNAVHKDLPWIRLLAHGTD